MKGTGLVVLAFVFAASACAKDPRDQDFVTKAAQAGMAEVQLGQLAAEKSAAPNIKAFGQRMVSDHTKVGDELKTIAAGAGANIPSEPSSDQSDTVAKLQKESGAAFDKAYATGMVKDHKDAVDLFKREASSGQNPDLKMFAQKTLPTLEEHLRMAQALTPN